MEKARRNGRMKLGLIFSQVFIFSFGSTGSINRAVQSKRIFLFSLPEEGKTTNILLRLSTPHIGYAKLEETLGGQSIFLCMAVSYSILSEYLAKVKVSLIRLLMKRSSLLGWEVKKKNEYMQSPGLY